MCSCSGDPHCHSVHGQKFDFQLVGEYSLFEAAGDMNVNVYTCPWTGRNGGAASIIGVLVQAGGQDIQVYQNSVTVDGSAITGTKDLSGGVKVTLGWNSYAVSTKSGAVVDIKRVNTNVNWLPPGYYYNVVATESSGGVTGGICDKKAAETRFPAVATKSSLFSSTALGFMQDKCPIPGASPGVCMWRQTAGCSPTGNRQPGRDLFCSRNVDSRASGWCDCNGNGQLDANEKGYDCGSSPGTCNDDCGIPNTVCPEGYKQMGQLGQDVPGWGLSRVNSRAPSKEVCAERCDDHPQCYSFEYGPGDFCALMEDQDDTRMGGVINGKVACVTKKKAKSPMCPAGYSSLGLPGADVPGWGLARIGNQAQSKALCAQQCNARADCGAFEFGPANECAMMNYQQSTTAAQTGAIITGKSSCKKGGRPVDDSLADANAACIKNGISIKKAEAVCKPSPDDEFAGCVFDYCWAEQPTALTGAVLINQMDIQASSLTASMSFTITISTKSSAELLITNAKFIMALQKSIALVLKIEYKLVLVSLQIEGQAFTGNVGLGVKVIVICSDGKMQGKIQSSLDKSGFTRMITSKIKVAVKKIKLKITLKKIGIAKYDPKAYASLYIQQKPTTASCSLTGSLDLKIKGSSSKLKIGFIKSIAKMLKISWKLVTVTKIVGSNVAFSIASSSQALADTMKVRMVSARYIKVFTMSMKKSYKIKILKFKSSGLLVAGGGGGGGAMLQGTFNLGGSGWKTKISKKVSKQYMTSLIGAFKAMLKVKSSSSIEILKLKTTGGFSLQWSISCATLDLADEWKLQVVDQQYMMIFVRYLITKLKFTITTFEAVDVQVLPAPTSSSGRRRKASSRRRRKASAPQGGRRLDGDEEEDEDDEEEVQGGADNAMLPSEDDATSLSDELDDLPLGNSLQLEETITGAGQKLDLEPMTDDEEISDDDVAALPDDADETFALTSNTMDVAEDETTEPNAA